MTSVPAGARRRPAETRLPRARVGAARRVVAALGRRLRRSPAPAVAGAAHRPAPGPRHTPGPRLVASPAAAVLAVVAGAALLASGAAADPGGAGTDPAPTSAAAAGGGAAAAAPDPAALAPRRLLVLDPRLLDGAVALGLRPLAAVTGSSAAGVPNYVDFAAGRAVAVVPGDASPDLLVGLRPDLVLGPEVPDPALPGPAPAVVATSGGPAPPGGPALDDLEVAYARLDAVAPVVRVPLTPGGPAADWRADLRALGGALGLRARAEEVIAGVDRRVAEVAAEVPAGERRSTAVLRVLADGVRVEPGPRVLAEVGLAAPADLPGADPRPGAGPDAWDTAATAERLFLAVGTYADLADPAPQLDAALRAPAWSTLPAAASGRTCLAAELPAWSVPGPLATRVVVDQVADCLASHARASEARTPHEGASADPSARSAG